MCARTCMLITLTHSVSIAKSTHLEGLAAEEVVVLVALFSQQQGRPPPFLQPVRVHACVCAAVFCDNVCARVLSFVYAFLGNMQSGVRA